MPDEEKLLTAIRVIVREEVQGVRDDLTTFKEDTKEEFDNVGKRFDKVEKKIEQLPEQLIEIITTPHLSPLPRPE